MIEDSLDAIAICMLLLTILLVLIVIVLYEMSNRLYRIGSHICSVHEKIGSVCNEISDSSCAGGIEEMNQTLITMEKNYRKNQ